MNILNELSRSPVFIIALAVSLTGVIALGVCMLRGAPSCCCSPGSTNPADEELLRKVNSALAESPYYFFSPADGSLLPLLAISSLEVTEGQILIDAGGTTYAVTGDEIPAFMAKIKALPLSARALGA